MADAAPVFIDTSCLAAHALGETGNRHVQTLMVGAARRDAASLAEAELMATHKREGFATSHSAAEGVKWISPSRRLTPELTGVLSVGYVRGAGAWHLACASISTPRRRNSRS